MQIRQAELGEIEDVAALAFLMKMSFIEVDRIVCVNKRL